MFRNRPLPSWLQEVAKEFISPPQFFHGLEPPMTPSTEYETPTPSTTTDSSGHHHAYRVTRTPDRMDRALKPVPASQSNSPSGQRVVTSINRRRPPGATKSSRRSSVKPASTELDFEQLRKYGAPTQLKKVYGWDVNSVEPMQGAVRVNTAAGVYVVKRTPISGARVQFLREALDYAASHGFTRFAELVLTEDGLPYVVGGGSTYYATRWIAGQTANFASTQQVGQVAHALAQFHDATRGFQPEAHRPDDEHDLYQMLAARRQDLRALIRQASQKRYMDDFDQVLVRLGPALQSDADQSVKLLTDERCSAFLRRAAANPGLCHLDVIPGNFIYDADRLVHLIDFDLSTFAPRVLDLAHLLRRSLQQQNWSSEVAYAGFLHYNMVRTMTAEEYIIVQALLTFPYRAWRLAHSRYRIVKDDTQVESLRVYESQERSRQAFLSAYARQVTKQQTEPSSDH